MSHNGRVVVCTGGGSGIGRAVVEAFADEGACVAVLERDASKVNALAALGERVHAMVGDATVPDDNQRLVDDAVQRWGRVDTAITFVGVFDFYTPLVEIPEARLGEAFEEIFSANVFSPLLTARATVSPLRASRGNLIFTLSSSSFHPGRGGTLYVASKHALRGAVVQLAHELAPEIRVNGVAPGGTIGTDLRGAAALGHGRQRLDDRPGRDEELRARTPLRVALSPTDHAGAYLYLASDAARGVTGEIVRSDGGLAAR